MKKSPKIILTFEEKQNELDQEEESEKKRQANQILFRIIEKLDYVYELNLDIDASFDVTAFPTKKMLRVSKLKISQQNHEKQSKQQESIKVEKIIDQIVGKSRVIWPNFLESIEVKTLNNDYFVVVYNDKFKNDFNELLKMGIQLKSEESSTTSTSSNQYRYLLFSKKKKKEIQQSLKQGIISGPAEFRAFIKKQDLHIEIDIDGLSFLEDRYLQNYEEPFVNDDVCSILIQCKTLKHHQVFIRRFLQECGNFGLLKIIFKNEEEEGDQVLDKPESILSEFFVENKKKRSLNIQGRSFSSIDNKICASIFKSLKQATKDLSCRIDICQTIFSDLIKTEITNLKINNVESKFLEEIPTLSNLRKITINEHRFDYLKFEVVDEALKKIFISLLSLKQLQKFTLDFVRPQVLNYFIDTVIEAKRKDLIVQILAPKFDLSSLRELASTFNIDLIINDDQPYKIPVSKLQELSKSCKKAKIDLNHFDAHYKQDDFKELMKLSNIKMNYKFKSTSCKQIETILTKAYLR